MAPESREHDEDCKSQAGEIAGDGRNSAASYRVARGDIGTIEEHTKTVLDELSKNLADAGSSLQKCLKVNVYLNDLGDYAAMNAVYRSYNWGPIPPVRTTVAPASGIPGNSLIEIDLIAYI